MRATRTIEFTAPWPHSWKIFPDLCPFPTFTAPPELTSWPLFLPFHWLHQTGHYCVHTPNPIQWEISPMRTSGTPDILPEAPDKTPSLNMDEPACPPHLAFSCVFLPLLSLSLKSDAKLRADASVVLNNSTLERGMGTLKERRGKGKDGKWESRGRWRQTEEGIKMMGYTTEQWERNPQGELMVVLLIFT